MKAMLVVWVMVLLSKVVMSLTVRTTLSQQQACYYQPFHKHLACMCDQEENLSYLPIKMEYWVRQMAQEVGMVVLQVIYISPTLSVLQMQQFLLAILQFLGNKARLKL